MCSINKIYLLTYLLICWPYVGTQNLIMVDKKKNTVCHMIIGVKGIFTFGLIVPPGGEYSPINRAVHILTCSVYVMP